MYQDIRLPNIEDVMAQINDQLNISDMLETESSGGMKFDTGKTMMGLVPPLAVEAIAEVMTYGAKKYAPHNWSKGIVYSRLIDALDRHLNSWKNCYESDLDPESNLNHLAHAACCLSFLLHFEVIKNKYNVQHNLDDRPTIQVF